MTSSVYSTGTVSVSNGLPIVTGTDTAWDVALVTGGMFSFAGMSVPIASVESDTSLTLAYGWPGATASGTYAIARETSEAVRAAWINDRLAQILTKLSLAGIHPDGAGTLAERNALSPVPAAGYLWLRVEMGYGLEFYKRTASGWDGPFGLTGPEGPAGTLRWIEGGWSMAAAYEYNDGLSRNGTSYRAFVAHASSAATEPGVGADWQTVWKVTAAKGDSFRFRGAYSGATAYLKNDTVRDNGSSWVALQPTTGNAPPALPATANAFWELMAVKGLDGTGTGDVVGPASVVANRLAIFDGLTGKLLKAGSLSDVLDMVGSPAEGDLLYRGASGWLRLPKGAAGQVLRQNTALTAPEWVTPAPISDFRNWAINGDFDHCQRATSQTASGYFSDDRWINGNSGTTKVHDRQPHSLGQTVVPGNPSYYSRTTVTSVAGPANYANKAQRIESVALMQGETVTVTFYGRTDGNRNIALEMSQSFGTGGSPSAVVTGIGAQLVALSNTWQKKSIVISVPSIAGKALGSSGNDYTELTFWFDAGTNYSSRTAGLGQQSGLFDISHVSVVKGNASSEEDPFSPRSIQQELALCQRYYWASSIQNSSSINTTAANYFSSITFVSPVTFRATPTAVVVNSVGATGFVTTKAANGTDLNGATNPEFVAQNINGGSMALVTASRAYFAGGMRLDAEL